MTPKSTRRIGHKTAIVVDLILFLVAILWTTFIELGVIPHHKTGFYCDDRSISYKFEGDTITATMLVISTFMPFFLMWIIEALLYEKDCSKLIRFKVSLSETGFWFREYAIGIIGKLLIVETLKLIVGGLRPHFLDSCRPDAAINCTGSTYISTYECTNQVYSFYTVSDSSKSFPSGHSSVSVFQAIFMIWYLQCKFPQTRSKLLLPFLQCLCLLWPCLCAASRITDHRHHWWDVLTGSLIGFVFAGLTCGILCKNFWKHSTRTERTIQNGTTPGDRHTSVRRLLSDVSTKDEVNMNHVTVP